MARVLVIPDVHMHTYMFDQADQILKSGQADFAVQLGDLFDDWGKVLFIELYEATIKRILRFSQDHPDTLWCMGNHDFPYYFTKYGPRCSGHSAFAEARVARLFTDNPEATKAIRQLPCHLVDHVMFSHAGFTSAWVATLTLGGSDYSPSSLEATTNALLDDPFEYSPLWRTDSPLWARPQLSPMPALYNSPELLLQVVGHTPVKAPTQKGALLSTDVFSSHMDGTPIGDQRFVVVDTMTGKWNCATLEE